MSENRGMDMVQFYELSPALVMEMSFGLEVGPNFRKLGGRDSGENLELDIDRMVHLAKKEGALLTAVVGPNSAGKGQLQMWFYDQLMLRLSKWAAARGIDFDIIPVHHELVAKACKLTDRELEVDSHYPSLYMDPNFELPSQFRMNPELGFADFTPAHERVFSDAMLWLIENYPQKRLRQPDMLTVTQIEVSTPLAFPKKKGLPIELDGVEQDGEVLDLGGRVFYELANNPVWKDIGFFYMLSRDKRVRALGYNSRLKIRGNDLDSAVQGDMCYLVPTSVGDLPLERLGRSVQEAVKKFVQKAQASPGGMDRFDGLYAQLQQELAKDGRIQFPSQQDYLEMVRSRLPIPRSRCSILENPLMASRKNYRLEPLLNSLAVRLMPGLFGDLDVLAYLRSLQGAA